jgi:hypothetical protein
MPCSAPPGHLQAPVPAKVCRAPAQHRVGGAAADARPVKVRPEAPAAVLPTNPAPALSAALQAVSAEPCVCLPLTHSLMPPTTCRADQERFRPWHTLCRGLTHVLQVRAPLGLLSLCAPRLAASRDTPAPASAEADHVCLSPPIAFCKLGLGTSGNRHPTRPHLGVPALRHHRRTGAAVAGHGGAHHARPRR